MPWPPFFWQEPGGFEIYDKGIFYTGRLGNLLSGPSANRGIKSKKISIEWRDSGVNGEVISIMGKGLLIAGTDTDVGKTLVAGGIAGALRKRGYRVGAMKPAESGCPREEGRLVPPDALFVKEMAGCDAPLDVVCPYRFEESLAPFIAAGRSGVEIDLERICSAYDELRLAHDVTLVEGIGGLLVPIRRDFLVSDLALRLNLPLLVVGRLGLGTLNHTLLTVETAARRGLEILGIVLSATSPSSSPAEETNFEILKSLTEIPVLGVLPHLTEVPSRKAHTPAVSTLIQAVEAHLDLGPLLKKLGLTR